MKWAIQKRNSFILHNSFFFLSIFYSGWLAVSQQHAYLSRKRMEKWEQCMEMERRESFIIVSLCHATESLLFSRVDRLPHPNFLTHKKREATTKRVLRQLVCYRERECATNTQASSNSFFLSDPDWLSSQTWLEVFEKTLRLFFVNLFW